MSNDAGNLDDFLDQQWGDNRNKETCDKAVIAALKSVENCCKYKRWFDETSLENFKAKNRQVVDILEEEFQEKLNEVTTFLFCLHNYALNSKNAEIIGAAEKAFTKAVECKVSVREEIIKDWNLEALLEPEGTESTSRTPSKPAILFESSNDAATTSKTSAQFDKRRLTFQTNKAETETSSEEDDEEEEYFTDAEENDNILAKAFRQLTVSMRQNRRLNIRHLAKSKQNARIWFEDFEFITSDWSDKERGLELPNWLDEEAQKFYEVASRETKLNYRLIKEYLIKELNTVDKEFEVLAEFYSTKQEVNESVDSFGQRLLSLQRECSQSDRQVIERNISKVFIKNCLPEIKKLIICYQSDHKMTFNEIWKKARSIEKCIKKEREISVDEISKEIVMPTETTAAVSSDKSKCYRCGKVGHFSKECKAEKKSSYQPCALCGRTNHLLNNCNDLKLLKSLLNERKLNNNNKPKSDNSKNGNSSNNQYRYGKSTNRKQNSKN